MKTIGILNGPNLDHLGIRETELYGTQTLEELNKLLQKEATLFKAKALCFQSNHEGDIIDKINEWVKKQIHGVVINPGAYTHTSIAIRDAIAGSGLPFIEVHISNLQKREPFRHCSYTASVCIGTISGLGLDGYLMALRYLIEKK